MSDTPYARASEEPASTTSKNPYEAPAGAGADSAGKQPRVWPGVVSVAAMWGAITIPPALFPESPKGFQPLFMGLLGGYALTLLWWVFASRVAWRDRFVGLGLVGGGLIVGIGALFHVSLRGGDAFLPIMFFVGPWLLSAIVAAMLLTKPIGWSAGRWLTLAVGLLGVVAAGLLRYEGVNSAFVPKFLARWQMNSEERLLASLEGGSRAPTSGGDQPAAPLGDADWPGFRGPARDGLVQPGALAGDWSKPPKELWRREIGPGWSSFCVVGDTVYTQEQRGENEAVTAYAAATGEPVWAATVEARFQESVAGPGPRATPTYYKGSLYATGADGDILRIDAEQGKILWQRDLITNEEEGRTGDTTLTGPPEWGFASSPLVVPLTGADAPAPAVAIVYAGNPKPAPGENLADNQAVIAYHAETGEPVWRSGAGYHGYSSPHLAVLGGVEQVLVATNLGLESLDPATGERLWFFDWDVADFPRSIQPLVVDPQTVVLSAGYDSGTHVIDVTHGDAWQAKERWKQPSHELEPYFNDMTLHNGHLYGIHKKFLVCVDLETGKQTWPRKVKRKSKLGNGQVVLDPQAGLLLVTEEDTGEVIIAEANPDTLVVRGRFEARGAETNWNHPVVAGGRLYVRNGVEAACFELPAPAATE